MTRSELVTALADEHRHLTLGDIERVVTAIFDEMTAALASGGRVELRGFGAFSVKRRRARVGRNPRTGQTVEVAEKSVPFFRAGRELREMVNAGGAVPGAESKVGAESKAGAESNVGASAAPPKRKGVSL